jgi:uncharacterized protein YndB with AHSA1/START domain
MPDILHRVGIKASPKAVIKALTTTEGLSRWWVVGTTGDPGRGGLIDFRFAEMRVVALTPGKMVKWKVVNGDREWIGTEITFRLKPSKRETFVLFSHAKWKKPSEMMHHCSTKWAVFLLSLKDWLERKEGRPHPYDLKIGVDD